VEGKRFDFKKSEIVQKNGTEVSVEEKGEYTPPLMLE
jgi:hypothetical protein